MKKIVFACLFLLSGCASTGIVPMGQDTYMIAKGGVRPQTASELLASIAKEANDYCHTQNKELVVLSKETVPGGLMVDPEARLEFKCTSSESKD